MMDFVANYWGDSVSLFGVIISSIGLIWAIKVAHGARSASRGARLATLQTSKRIQRYLQTVDLERSVGLVQRLKLLHSNEQWQAALEHYQQIRAMMADIIERCPQEDTERQAKLATARILLRDMENFVASRARSGIRVRDRSRMQQLLNQIQSDLEEVASRTGFGD